MQIFKEFTFEAAHHLPNVAAGHKCGRLHGHSYRIAVYVSGDVQHRSGWVRDFSDIGCAWKPIHIALDHRYLNEVGGLENPTSENLARWIWERLIDVLPDLTEVMVRETCTSGCIYRGEA